MTRGVLYPRCAGLDVHKDSVVARIRCVSAPLHDEVGSFADAAGFGRFIWCGYSWGAVVGLQIASGFDRLAALVCGGWPPLGGEYSKMLRGARALVREPPSEGPYAGFDAAPFATFYESIQSWPEGEAVRKISCPRLVLFGSEDATSIGVETVHIAATLRERSDELQRLGWCMSEIPGRDHALCADPTVVVPHIRKFLDTAVSPAQRWSRIYVTHDLKHMRPHEQNDQRLIEAFGIVEDAWHELRGSPFVQQQLGVTLARLPCVALEEAQRRSELGRSLLKRLDALHGASLPHDLDLTLWLVDCNNHL